MSDKITSVKEPFEVVPERGSLGLLALGAIGLIAWREKMAEKKKEKKDTNNIKH